MIVIVIVAAYLTGWFFSWRALIRWGIEDYKASGLYPKYWDMGNVAILTCLSFPWPLGVLAGYFLIKPRPPTKPHSLSKEGRGGEEVTDHSKSVTSRLDREWLFGHLVGFATGIILGFFIWGVWVR